MPRELTLLICFWKGCDLVPLEIKSIISEPNTASANNAADGNPSTIYQVGSPNAQ